GLIMAGFAWGDGNPDHFRQGTTPVNFDWSGWKTIGLSLMWITFAYSGWNASTYIGAEIKKPEWTLPRSLVLGTGIVSVLYLFINMLFVWSTPPEALSGVVSVGDVAVSNLFGRSMGDVVSVMITVALLSSISAFIILGPRVYYAMAVDGYFFRFAARLHPKSQAPVWSIVMQAGISIVIILSGTLDQVLTYMGFSLGIFPLLTIAGLFKLRASGKSKIRLPGFPFTAVIYLIIGLGILLLSFFERPVESSVAIGTVVLGVPFYFLFRKSKG
ncbi:MAG: amino acid permease, partial [Cyclobacteriaceae bacterium]|nr:amino acid permease [Cyclobacteriaceae bacterium]